jgi:hypothetical protein
MYIPYTYYNKNRAMVVKFKKFGIVDGREGGCHTLYKTNHPEHKGRKKKCIQELQ